MVRKRTAIRPVSSSAKVKTTSRLAQLPQACRE